MANIKLSSLKDYEWTLGKDDKAQDIAVDIALPFSLRQIGDRLFCCTKKGVFSFNENLEDKQSIFTRNAKPLGNYLHPAVILDVASQKDTEDEDIFIYGTQGGILYEDQEPTQNGEEKKPNQIDTDRTRESFFSVAVDGASIYACSNTKKDYQVHKYNLAQPKIKHNLTVGCDHENSFPRIALYDDGIAVMNATSGTLRFLHKDFTRNGIVEGIDDQPHLCYADKTEMLVAKFQTKKLELYKREKNDLLYVYGIQLKKLDIYPITAVLLDNDLFIAGWCDANGLGNGKILKFVKVEMEDTKSSKPKDMKIDMDVKEVVDKKPRSSAQSRTPTSSTPAQSLKKGDAKKTDNVSTTPKRKTPKTDKKVKKEDGFEDELSTKTEEMTLQ